MNHFNSIRELLNTLNRGHKLLAELFEKRKSLSYKYEYALDVLEGNDDIIQLLINKDIIRQNGNFLELDDQFLQFFEQILEVNEEINTSYINENIRQVKDEYMLYYLQANSDGERYKYLKAVKSSLRKIGRITVRNILDLSRNIENTFKTEPNYKIKLSKLEVHKQKLTAIQLLIEQTEKLITEDELTFFKTATDEELRAITTQLRLELTESRQNLIETRKQIIEYINQIKYQSKFIEKLRLVKYLRDQYEIKAKTNLVELINNNRATVFESKPSYPLKISVYYLQTDVGYDVVKKLSRKIKTGVRPSVQMAEVISQDYLKPETEKEVFINIHEVKNSFTAGGNHLFDFLLNYKFIREVPFDERVTVFCQMISMFEEDFDVTEKFNRHNDIEYAVVYPK
ncbi:MAG: hypothetical protein WCP85_15875 [Mariniphaga sp.]